MAKTHKKQHVVPRSYTAAWTDPATPEGLEPYVWTWTKLGTRPQRRAPANLFTQTDMYTVMNGEKRLLHLEHGLSTLESGFARIHRDKLAAGATLTDEDKVYLSAFTVAMFNRTSRQKAHHQDQFGRIFRSMAHLHQRMTKGDTVPSADPVGPEGMHEPADIAFARAVAEQPLDLVIPQALGVLTPIYARRSFAFKRAPSGIQFITSDNPCMMHDPTWKPGSPWGIAPAAPTTQLVMPISPRLCMVIAYGIEDGYAEATERFVQLVNDQVRGRCDERYVSSSGEIGGNLFPALPWLGSR